MPLSDDIISASALLCERVLRETDGVVSAIRVVDLFQFIRLPEVPIDNQGVDMRILVLMKFKETSLGPCRVGFVLTRPDGTLGEPQYTEVSLVPPTTPYTHVGLTLSVQVVVIPKQEGAYYWTILLDGAELTKVPFTLLERKQESAL